jgi:hypothetical protein
MTLLVGILVATVAVAAAARSTWSPCGLSMLSTITPVSERAKGNSYRSTTAWFVLGATVGGATLGATMAALAVGVQSLGLAPRVTTELALGAAVIAVFSDAGIGGFKLPVHHRQVNERWLDHYRPWVYGAGFGWQIGAGLVTYITTAAVYLLVILGALSARPLVALTAGIAFGVLRGLAVLLTRRVTTPSELRTFHRRFHRAGPLVGRVTVVIEAGAAVALFAYLRSALGVAIVGMALGAAVLASVVVRRRGPISRPDGAAVAAVPAVPAGSAPSAVPAVSSVSSAVQDVGTIEGSVPMGRNSQGRTVGATQS